MSIIQTFPLSPSVDTSDCMKKGVDYVTAGAATGSTIGSNATADGRGVTAYGSDSHAEGLGTTSYGGASHAEGYDTYAGDSYTHAEGYMTSAYNESDHAEGNYTCAAGWGSHAEGSYTSTGGGSSHSEGFGTYAAGNSSHAEGYCTTAYGDNQTVVGKYNIVDNDGNYAFIVGNGTSTTASNAFGVKWDGTVEAGGHALGTAAFKNIPSSGNAGNSEVVLGNDSRLSDSRTPTSHTHTKSEITDFPTLGTAAAKDYTSSVTQSSTDLVTSGAVWSVIDNLPEPMVFKGTLGTGGTITDLPTAAAANHGDTYKVITAGTYASIVAKIGDVFTSDGSSWVLIPAGDTDSDTWRAIKVNGTEKLGSAISTGAVDFVNGTNTTASFDATGSKVSFSATDEKVTGQEQNPTSGTNYDILWTNGTTNQKPYYNNGFRYKTLQGTASAAGYSRLTLGNSVATGTAGNKRGEICIYTEKSGAAIIKASQNSTAERTLTLPDKTGTIALTSDLSSYIAKSGDTMTGRLTMGGKPISQVVTGSGTVGQDKGSGQTNRYVPSEWVFNTGVTVADGDIFTIKIPVAGISYGVWVSMDNGTTYYPVAINGTTRLGTQYGVNSYLTLQYENASSVTVYARGGSDSSSSVTKIFRVLNFYNSDTNTQMRIYRQNTSYNNDYPLIASRTLASSIGTAGTNSSYTAIYGVMWDDTTKVPTLNPSTGEIKAVKFTGAFNGTATKATQDSDGNAINTTYMKKGIDRVTAGKVAGSTVGTNATAEGESTIASGNYSHAEGYATTAKGNYSHAEGFYSNAVDWGAHAEGGGTLIGSIIYYGGTAYGRGSHAEGCETYAKGQSSHTEGHYTTTWDDYSHAEGYYTCASGKGAHAEGGYATTTNKGTLAQGNNSHAEGCLTKAIGTSSHAEGYNTTAGGNYSHAEGYSTSAAEISHAEGYASKATVSYTHAEGYMTTAQHNYSHSEGHCTKTGRTYQHVGGYYNRGRNNTLFEIGNGSSGSGNERNVFEVGASGITTLGDDGIEGRLKIVAGNSGNTYGNALRSLSGVPANYDNYLPAVSGRLACCFSRNVSLQSSKVIITKVGTVAIATFCGMPTGSFGSTASGALLLADAYSMYRPVVNICFLGLIYNSENANYVCTCDLTTAGQLIIRYKGAVNTRSTGIATTYTLWAQVCWETGSENSYSAW